MATKRRLNGRFQIGEDGEPLLAAGVDDRLEVGGEGVAIRNQNT